MEGDDNLFEVARTQSFESGDTACIRCGKVLHLYFNGGELDRKECCGLVYRTVVQRTDLVVYEKTPITALPSTCARQPLRNQDAQVYNAHDNLEADRGHAPVWER